MHVTPHHSRNGSCQSSFRGRLGGSSYTCLLCCVNLQRSNSSETMSWDPTRARVCPSHRAQLPPNSSLSSVLSSFQAQFRFAAQKLGQLQDKYESQGQITKGDIATLLRQGNIGLARAKAESAIKNEIHADLLQVLEMYLGVVLEQFAEIDKKYFGSCPVVGSTHLVGHNQVNSRSSTCRSCVRDYLLCSSSWYSGCVCVRDQIWTSVHPCLQNYRWPVTFSSNDLAKNLPALQLGIKIDMSLPGYVAIIVLPVFPINSRIGRSSSFSPPSISCDARRLPRQGSQGLWYRMDPWVTIAREVRSSRSLHVKFVISF